MSAASGLCPSPLEVTGQARLQPGPDMAQGFDDCQIEDRGPEVGLIVEGAGEGVAGFAALARPFCARLKLMAIAAKWSACRAVARAST